MAPITILPMDFININININIKKSLAHLPERKAGELEQIVCTIRALCEDSHMVILFGSYARGDWKDGPHEQGRGKMVIHKKSDYDILVVTANESTARDICLWDEIKERLNEKKFSAHVRIIPRDINFVNYQLGNGQYFFTEICEQGIVLYDSGRFKFVKKKKLSSAEEKRIAQEILDDVFQKAKNFYILFGDAFEKTMFKEAAFLLHQAVEHAYKTVLLIFGSECPQEHHLDILGNLAADYCPELTGLIPRKTDEEKELFELLDYAYIGARYDRDYKISHDQLKQLAPCVQSLLEITECVCKKRIKEFADAQA